MYNVHVLSFSPSSSSFPFFPLLLSFSLSFPPFLPSSPFPLSLSFQFSQDHFMKLYSSYIEHYSQARSTLEAAKLSKASLCKALEVHAITYSLNPFSPDLLLTGYLFLSFLPTSLSLIYNVCTQYMYSTVCVCIFL